MAEFKTLWESKNHKIYTLIFEYNGRKFRIYCEHTNGAPLGFNYKCCLDVMKPDGTFAHVVDNNMVEVNWKNEYCSVGDSRRKENNEIAIKAFKEFVEKIY